MLMKPPLVADTGLIIRFGDIGRMDILQSLYSGNIMLPSEVIVECIEDSNSEKIIQHALQMGWMEEFNINYTDHPDIVRKYAQLSKKFEGGEVSVMAIASVKGWTVGSDDIRATLKFCQSNSVPLITSLGILYHAYDSQLISGPDGDHILKDMISKTKFKTPVSNFNEVIGWFKHGKGRQLF